MDVGFVGCGLVFCCGIEVEGFGGVGEEFVGKLVGDLLNEELSSYIGWVRDG